MPKSQQGKCVVFDVGKSSAKVSVVGADGHIWATRRCAIPHLDTPLYRAFDTDALYDWLMAQLRDLGSQFAIDRIIPVTHGATCAFLDRHLTLVQPIQDYESSVPADFAAAYRRIRPDFDETLSPSLPDGQNLGCQIFWHAHRAPSRFRRVRWILNYPQYWVWRLTGHLSNEMTSMGCHTDLWCPVRKDFSSLAINQGWADLFADMQPAWQADATLRRDVAYAANLPPTVKVCVGVHDSNAALANVICDRRETPPAVLSTGTWYVAMAPGAHPAHLPHGQADCLGNVDIYGRPVPCARFMGGRMYPTFADGRITLDSLTAVMRGRHDPASLGLLSIALIASDCLDAIRADGPLLVEGPVAGNPLLCGLLASLRPGQVVVDRRLNAVALGAARLAFHDAPPPTPQWQTIAPVLQDEVRRYHHRWQDHIAGARAA